MSKTKAIIFDWGGVLMRTESYEPRHAWDSRLGLEPGFVERIVHGCDAWRDAQMGTVDLQTYWQEVAQQLNLTPEMGVQLQREFYQGDQLDQRMVGLIHQWREQHHKIGLLSNNVLTLLDEMNQLGVRHLFDACVISAQIGVMKPAPAAYHAILEELGIEPAQAVFIDDVAENIVGAEAVGMRGVLFTPDLDLQAVLEDWLDE